MEKKYYRITFRVMYSLIYIGIEGSSIHHQESKTQYILTYLTIRDSLYCIEQVISRDANYKNTQNNL